MKKRCYYYQRSNKCCFLCTT